MTTKDMLEELDPEVKKRLEAFDPSKPFVIEASEIKGLEHFTGRFIFRRPTVSDRLKIGVRAAKLKDNASLDVTYDNIAYILATFAVIATEKPQGFDFDNAYEVDSLFELYERYNEWLTFFRIRVQLNQENTSEQS